MTTEQEKILADFKQKILSAKLDDAKISEVAGNFEIKTAYAVGKINFYALDVLIVEMSVTNLADDENKFYLHFELRDLKYAEELFAEMLATITDLKSKQTVKILLSCTGGLTTGFFADKLNESAKILELDYKIDAVPFHKLYEVAQDYSVIFLAPQIAYQAQKVSEILSESLVLKIPAKIFASYDSGEMLQFIRENLENYKKTAAERIIAKVKKGIITDAKILSIAILPSKKDNRIAYKIYKKGEIIFEETVIKKNLNLVSDLCDILDTVGCRGKKFKAVGIATAGAIHDGHLDLKEHISPEFNLKKFLEEKYKIPVTITNNLKAASLGFYVQQEKFENILFLSRPYGFRSCGIGMVLNGKVFDGAHNMAGEVRYAMQSFLSKEDWEKNFMINPEKVLESLLVEIRIGISVVDPEVICLRSDMTPELEEIKNKVAEIIPEKYLPEFVKFSAKDMQELALLGEMILSLEELERRK